MRQEMIMATTHIDRHNCRFTKESLEDVAARIKTGDRVPRATIEHDLTLPPYGKLIDAHVEKREDGEYQLVAVQESFESLKEIQLSDGTILLEEGTKEDQRPFVIGEANFPDKIRLHTDFVNFASKQDCDDFIRELQNSHEFDSSLIGRKALVPDPEILFTVTKSLLLYLGGKKLLEKMGDRIIDEMVEDGGRLYSFLKTAVVTYAKYAVPKNRPITYVFEIPEPIRIEFVVRTSDPNRAMEAILQEKIAPMIERAEELTRTLKADCVQFLLNENGEWEFNYLLTATGSVIGTPMAYGRRKKQFQILMNNISSMKKDEIR